MLIAKTYHFSNQCLSYSNTTLWKVFTGPQTPLDKQASISPGLQERIKSICCHILNIFTIPLALLSYAVGQLAFSAALLSEKTFFSKPAIDLTTPYGRLVQFLRGIELALIEKKLAVIKSQKSSQVDALLTACHEANYSANIFMDADCPYYALLALKEDQITLPFFATLMIYCSSTDTYGRENVQVISLVKKDGELDEAALKYLEPQVKSLEHVTGNSVKNLFQEMARLPALEKVFFVLKNSEKEAANLKGFLFPYSPEIFRVFEQKDKPPLCMAPSWGIMDRLLAYMRRRPSTEDPILFQITPVISSAIQNHWKHGLFENKTPQMIRLSALQVVGRTNSKETGQDFSEAVKNIFREIDMRENRAPYRLLTKSSTHHLNRFQKMIKKVEKIAAWALFLPLLFIRLIALQGAILFSDLRHYQDQQDKAAIAIQSMKDPNSLLSLCSNLSNVFQAYQSLLT